MESIENVIGVNEIDIALNWTEQLLYRPYSPSQHLYLELLKIDIEKDFDSFIYYSYLVLKAWDMDSRGAKLAGFEKYRDILTKQKQRILDMHHSQQECCDGLFKTLPDDDLNNLFDSLKPIVARRNNAGRTISHLVAVSKLIHFMFPYVVPPMDRKYTAGALHFSFGPGNEKTKFIAVIRDYRSFIEKNKDVFQRYCLPYKTIDLNNIKTLTWNTTAMKSCDNLLIWKINK